MPSWVPGPGRVRFPGWHWTTARSMGSKQTVGILGAGLSGLAAAIQLSEAGLDDFVIYERNEDVGGTWLINTYPGLHCDTPSHLYGYSFEPDPDWSMVYAPEAEIQSYLRRAAEHRGLIEKIRFATDVRSGIPPPGATTSSWWASGSPLSAARPAPFRSFLTWPLRRPRSRSTPGRRTG